LIDREVRNRGSNHRMSKLTEADVREIRALGGKMTQPEIAAKFGVSKWTVGDIIRGKRWGWAA
jgi:DNA-binding transcriptional regulator YiaG